MMTYQQNQEILSLSALLQSLLGAVQKRLLEAVEELDHQLIGRLNKVLEWLSGVIRGMPEVIENMS